MYNWSVDENYLKKFPKKYQLWRLEQLLTYGLDGKKLNKKEVVANWKYLKNRLDPKRKELIEFFYGQDSPKFFSTRSSSAI